MSELPAVSGSGGLIDAVDAVFAPGGRLSRAIGGFESRPGQRRMARAVAGVLAEGGTLLAEAGTGTGKTLAYLVPAVLAGRRVLVSTGTKNLQEQIFFKDLPLIRRAVGVPFTACYMKGRANYLCLHRFEQLRAGGRGLTPGDRLALTLVEEWLPRTETGDRAELEELPDELGIWPDIAATQETCLGSECPRFHDCFVTRMRQRAAESDVVIVNHHLLCADAAVRRHSFGEVIPECQALVIDEAHQLEDVATQYFGVSVSNFRMERLVGDGERLLSAGQIDGTAAQIALIGALQRALDVGRQFFQSLLNVQHDAAGSRLPGSGIEERRRLSEDALGDAGARGLDLLEALSALEQTVAGLRSATEDVASLGRRAAEMRDDLRFLLRLSDPDFVYFLETRGRGVFLRASPIDVSRVVRDHLLDRMHTAVLTSATLAIDGSFDYVKGRLGIDAAVEERLPSEFDYATQAILYLPDHMPDPRSADFAPRAADEAIAILQRTEGRAFVLFTSYAVLREVESRVRAALPYPLLVQGAAPRSVLLSQFRHTPNAVLLATSSFWQGVDVVGEALSCVIIDKLPFASPAEPITAARIDAVRRRGGDPFSEYQVPLAILSLLQGLGRLLRHRDDRGVLAVLDPRIRTRRYGARFLAALPRTPITRSLDDITRFFGRGDDSPAWRGSAARAGET